jgi:hypothetical protein
MEAELKKDELTRSIAAKYGRPFKIQPVSKLRGVDQPVAAAGVSDPPQAVVLLFRTDGRQQSELPYIFLFCTRSKYTQGCTDLLTRVTFGFLIVWFGDRLRNFIFLARTTILLRVGRAHFWAETLDETGAQRPLGPNFRNESAGRGRSEALHSNGTVIMGD